MTKKTKSQKQNPEPKASKQTRVLKSSRYKSFRLSKKISHPAPPLPSAWSMFKESVRHLRDNQKIIAGILGIFIVLYVIFVRGFAVSDLGTIKDAFNGEEAGTSIGTGLGLFVYLLGNSASSPSESASIYQFLLIVLTGLAIIWVLRQSQTPSKKTMTVRKAYYQGTSQFVPYLLVLGAIGLQLLPALIGTTLYQQVITAGLAASNIEAAAWTILLGASLLLSFYMLSSSLFAQYIVTLPRLTPMQALASARELVRYRRAAVMRKILFLPFVLFVLGALFLVPFLLYVTTLGELLFLLYWLVCLPITHAYMYQLYRKLL
jgi:hypothetical protein